MTEQIRLRRQHQTLAEPERATGGGRTLASQKINLQCKNNAGRPTLIGPGRQQLTGTACLSLPPCFPSLPPPRAFFCRRPGWGSRAPRVP